MIYAICALAMLGSQGPQSAADTVLATYKIADREVAAKIPPTKLALPKCSGISDGEWTYLFDSAGKLRGRVVNGGGWAEVAALHASAKVKFDDKTSVWKVKAVVITRFDVLQKSDEGALLLRRSTLENSQVMASLEALARFAAVADAYGQGRYKVSLDVSIENEPMRFGPINKVQPFAGPFCQSYFGPRINGGNFESEDKVYRGPYDSVFFIHAGWKEDGQPWTNVNGMPVHGIAFAPKDDMSPGQDLAVELLNRWCGDVRVALKRKGVPAAPQFRFALAPDGSLIGTDESSLSYAGMASASNRARVSTDELVSSYSLLKEKPSKPWSEVADDPIGKLSCRPDRSPLSADPILLENKDGKSYLNVRINFADFVGKHLKASLKPVATGWFSDSKSTFIVFALDSDPGSVNDRDLLDIKTEAVAVGDESVKEFPAIPNGSMISLEGFNYVFKASDDPASPEAKIAKAIALTDSSSQAEKAEVIEMLSAREDQVKLNAAQAFARVKEPNAVKPLIDMVSGFNLRVVEIALTALQFQGGPEADAAIHKALVNGRYGYVQAVAAALTASRNNPKDAQHLAVLLASDSWTAWLAGAKAIASYDDKNAQTFLQGFIRMTDPAVRLEVTKGSNPTFATPASNLLWTAVNDPSDLVRVAAYIRLIESSNEAHREEGYKGLRDDSIFVRLQLLDYLRKAHSESSRKALQTAVADGDPEVRAAALRAYQALDGQLTLEEIQNTLTDKDPRVQSALVELALAKKLMLPADTVALLRSSLDIQVAERAKGLAE